MGKEQVAFEPTSPVSGYGQTKTLKEWAIDLKVTLAGIRLRYHKNKDYSPEEILFGKKKPKKKRIFSA